MESSGWKVFHSHNRRLPATTPANKLLNMKDYNIHTNRTNKRGWEFIRTDWMKFTHFYPFSSQLMLNLKLALSWVQRKHLSKLCYKGHIRVLHLTVHELVFGGRNREKTEQAPTYNLLHHNLVLYYCAKSAYIR